MQYLAHWPEYFQVAESPTGEIMGYSKFYSSISSITHALFHSGIARNFLWLGGEGGCLAKKYKNNISFSYFLFV